MLAGLGCAHAVAARVVARVVARCGKSAGSLVDFAVYRPGGLLRLLGSSKLVGEARVPLQLSVEHSSAAFDELSPRELLGASLVQPARGGLSAQQHARTRALPLLSDIRLCVCCLVCVCSCGHHGWLVMMGRGIIRRSIFPFSLHNNHANHRVYSSTTYRFAN